MDAGYALYCLGSSGVILNTATAAGVQSLTLRRAFRCLDPGDQAGRSCARHSAAPA